MKETIVQFVGFITELGKDEFAPKWDGYVKNLMHKKAESTLYIQETDTRNKFRYLSKHEWAERDFNFSFMKEKKSDHFPEHDVRVVQTGGYLFLQQKKKYTPEAGNKKLIAFVSHEERDIEYYRQLPLCRHLSIYQAYYESCSFGYVMEFFVPGADSEELLMQLKQRPGVETGIYKQCLLPKTKSALVLV